MISQNETDRILRYALHEDLHNAGDITSQATVPADKTITVEMNAREEGRLAGIDIAARVFELVDDSLKVEVLAEDGTDISSREVLLKASGNARSILQAERLALNIVSHLSGIATKTAQMVTLIEGTNAKLCDTRKTLPGLRGLQKYAVKMGGGVNHRFGLYDGILIKDNHIAAAGGIKAALDRAQNYAGHMVKIEIEVDTLAQLQEVLEHGGADIVMLDNFTPKQLKEAITLINGRFIAEYSGNATQNNIREIALSGVDFISSGALTHSVKALDIGLDFK